MSAPIRISCRSGSLSASFRDLTAAHLRRGTARQQATLSFPSKIWWRITKVIRNGAKLAERIVTARTGPDRVAAGEFKALPDPAGTQIKVLVDMAA